MKLQTKPFVRWAGGKSQLLPQFANALPLQLFTCESPTYIEPFVGGGALLFYLLRRGIPFRHVVINDINKDLIQCYRLIRERPEALLVELKRLDRQHYELSSEEGRRNLYYAYREQYNHYGALRKEERAALFLYLNHTCFNGLYRVNREGKFNVPYASRKKPNIFNEKVIMADSEILNQVELTILNSNYECVEEYVRENTFVYLDPPYKPLNGTSYFKEYSNCPFEDKQQENLKVFCDRLTQRGAWLMLSNSDARNEDGSSYFEQLYNGYYYQRVQAPRLINAKPQGRSKLSEMLITNYKIYEQ